MNEPANHNALFGHHGVSTAYYAGRGTHNPLHSMSGPEFTGAGAVFAPLGLLPPVLRLGALAVLILIGMAGCSAAWIDYQHYTPSPNICRSANSGLPPERADFWQGHPVLRCRRHGLPGESAHRSIGGLMASKVDVIPLGVTIHGDIEERGKVSSFRARVRWTDPVTKARPSKSDSFDTREEAEEWIEKVRQAAARGVDPKTATATLKDYGNTNWDTAMRGLEEKTAGDAYKPAWRLRVVPTLGHLPVTMISAGVADRAVGGWIADGSGRSAIKNSLAALARVLDQAVRDEVIDRNRVDVTGWQRQFDRYEDELDDPRSLALPSWEALTTLADALVAASTGRYQVWGNVVIFAACTAARIGEVSGCRVQDIDTKKWIWTLRRQTSPGPGGLTDKGTKGKRSRRIPIIQEVRPMVLDRIAAANGNPGARLFLGPRGGRIQTGVLRRATHWPDVVAALGYEHLRRHDLRHTGLTWFADAGVPLHRLQQIAGHTDPRVTQRYLHPDIAALQNDGDLLSRLLTMSNGGQQIPEMRVSVETEPPPNGPKLRIVK